MADAERYRRVTVEELRDWREAGATWRPVELGDQLAVIDLCSCTGEAMDRVSSDDQQLIAYVRAHRGD